MNTKPDWSDWRTRFRVKVWEAAYLSCDLNPENWSNFNFVENVGKGKELRRRQDLLQSHLLNARFFTQINEGSNGEVNLGEFAAFALHFGWSEIPDELRSLAASPQAAKGGALGNADTPGKVPRISVGKLAIKAAWQIECTTQRAATAKAVMTRLQEWADAGGEPDVLLKSDKENRGVKWRTMRGVEKLYDLEACKKTLGAWMKSRA